MKPNQVVAVFVAALSIGSAMAQQMGEGTIPSAIKQAFAKSYAQAKHVKWDKEGKDYEASFELNGEKKSAVFSSNGQQTELEMEIPVAKLPETVRSYMKGQGKTIKEAAQITDASGKQYYEAEAGGKDYLFNAQGKPVKKIGE